MKRLLLPVVLLAAGLSAAPPAGAGEPAPTRRQYHYTPHYRGEAPRREPAHQRSYHRNAGPVRKVYHRREWWERHDQDDIVIDEDDGIVIEEDDGIVIEDDAD